MKFKRVIHREPIPHRSDTLDEALMHLLQSANGQPTSIRAIVTGLAGKGSPALLTIIGLPFCLPITIPGLSTSFGILVAFIGLRIAFGRHFWLPEWLMNKEIPYGTLEKIVTKSLSVLSRLKRFIHPRWTLLTMHRLAHVMNGLAIAFLGLLLALPIPLPFTNFAAAVPIVCFGLGLLEDDGYLIVAAYMLLTIAIAFFAVLFWTGVEGLTRLGFF